LWARSPVEDLRDAGDDDLDDLRQRVARLGAAVDAE